jgi:hypothetical protein
MPAATNIAFVIVRATMFDPLLEADPSFNDDWQDFLREWKAEPELPLYLARRLERGDL